METQTLRISVGEKAPDFSLQTDQGKKWRLSDNIGNIVALLFYPKNETFVCTKQMCSVRDNWHKYLDTGATVVAVSPGTVEEHQSFVKNHNLPITILADIDKIVTDQFCSHPIFPTFLTRSVVIIDAKGFVRSKSTMLRAFRPPEFSVLTSIYNAKTDLLMDEYGKLTRREKIN